MRSLNRFNLLLIVLSALVTPNAFGQKLKVRDVKWGFDDRVVPNEFSPVSILLDNQSEEAFDSVVTLRRMGGVGRPTGASFVQPVYVQPHGLRWVQFVPHFGPDPKNNQWRLSWNRGGERLRQVTDGPAAVVALSTGDMGLKGTRNFDESLFPTSVTATRGLQSVFLDHVPRWELPRRQAFIDWLRLGGQLHLLKSDGGEYPEFSEELSVLNSPQRQQRVGSGRVYRHNIPGSGVNSAFVKRIAVLEQNALKAAGSDEEEQLDADIKAQKKRSDDFGEVDYQWSPAERAQSSLQRITQPDHNWPLIYVLSFLYILIIFPGCYLVGKRRSHYMVTYGAILGAATLFSLGFLFVGRRGYGESTAVNSVAVATNIDGDRWDVTQWSNVFVTRGDAYQLAHAGTGTLYATGQETESVRGVIGLGQREDGKVERSFQVEIPPFSNRSYVHRQVVSLPNYSARLESIAIGKELTALTVQVGEGLRAALQPIEYTPAPSDDSSYYAPSPADRSLPVTCVAYQNAMYALNSNPTTGVLTLGSRLGSIDQAVGSTPEYDFAPFGGWYEESTSPESIYARLFDTVAAHHFGMTKVSVEDDEPRLPPDRVRLMIYTKAPQEMLIQGDTFARQRGFVLFSQDLPIEIESTP